MFTITLLSMGMALSLSIVVWRMVRDDRRRSEARVHALTDLAVRPDIHASAPAPAISLAVPAQGPAWGRRAAIIASVALALIATVLMMLTARTRAAIPAAVDTAGAAATGTGPLELLSLRDTREGGTLTIAGLVGNPRGAALLHNVKVNADVFDASGAMVTRGAAALDVRALAPGDQSPFVLSVTTNAPVAKYRVSFVNADGRVIEHIDHRRQAADPSSW
jgi:hypothetical protein